MALPGRDIPFFGVAVVFSDLLRTGYRGTCVWRPDLMPARKPKLVQLNSYLGFASSKNP